MELKIKKLASEKWDSWEISRYMVDSEYMGCYLEGGFENNPPQKGNLYDIIIIDPDNNIEFKKIGMFLNYNHVVDKDGSSAPVICDNSFNFQVVG